MGLSKALPIGLPFDRSAVQGLFGIQNSASGMVFWLCAE